MAGLNAQTAAQFQQYAAQQHPGKYRHFHWLTDNPLISSFKLYLIR